MSVFPLVVVALVALGLLLARRWREDGNGPGTGRLVGVERFQVLTTGLEFPLPQPSETDRASRASLARLKARQNTTAQSLFQNFLRVARELSLAAIFPALAIGPERRRVGQI